jgi:hypothetical protein
MRTQGLKKGSMMQREQPKNDSSPSKERAAWAVAVLDYWALRNSGFAFKTGTSPLDCDAEEPWICSVSMDAPHRHLTRCGVSPDAARIAVAEALVDQDPTLRV